MQATRGTSLTSTDPSATGPDESPGTDAVPADDARGSSSHRLVFAVVAVTAYAVDVVTKVLAVRHLTAGDPVDVVDGLLRLDLTRNPGAAFSTGTSYTIVLSSLPLSAGANAARGKGLAALRAGLQQVGVLVSSSYPSLQPGYYVVFTGIYPAKTDADAAVGTVRQAGFGGAYSRQIAR